MDSDFTSHSSPLIPPYAQQNGFLASLQSAKLPPRRSLYTCSSSALHIYMASFLLFRFLLRCHLFRFNSTPTLSPPIGLVSLHSSGPSPTRHRLVQVPLHRPGRSREQGAHLFCSQGLQLLRQHLTRSQHLRSITCQSLCHTDQLTSAFTLGS